MNLAAFALAVGLLVAPILGAAGLTTSEAKAQTPPSCGVPLALDDGWPIDTPDALGFDRSRLCGLADRLREADDVLSVVVARHGRLAFEQNFAGYDEPWGYDAKRYEFDAKM